MIRRLNLGWLLVLLVGTGCGDGYDTSGTSGGQRRFLSIGTAPPGGAFFVVGSAIAEVLNASRGDQDWTVSAEATKGSQENIRRLARRELDLALSNASITYFAVRGEEGWDRAYPVQALMTLAPNIALFVTPADSGIRLLADLRGQRVVVGPAGAGFEFFLKPMLAEHGLDFADFTPLHGTQSAAVDMLADASAAAAFLGGAVPTASITQASTTQEVYFIPFDEEARQRLIRKYPFFQSGRIPAGTYRGQTEDFQGLNVGSMHLITSADQDEELAYALTKIIYENRDAMIERHAAGRAINPANVVHNTGTEFHPGAIRYYREIGIWPDSGEAAPAPAADSARAPE